MIGERVSIRRMQMGMSQATLGETVGVAFQQIQKYERGRNRIGAGRLIQIARALECDVTDLFGSSDKRKPKTSSSFTQFATKDGFDMIEAFTKIEALPIRRLLINLARQLAER